MSGMTSTPNFLAVLEVAFEDTSVDKESVSVPATEKSHWFAHDFGPVPAKVFAKQASTKGYLPRTLKGIADEDGLDVELDPQNLY